MKNEAVLYFFSQNVVRKHSNLKNLGNKHIVIVL